MPILCQGTGVAFVVAAADVIQHQGAFLQVACGEFFLDAPLSFQQPVHGLIQVVFLGLAHPQLLGQGGAVPVAGGSQFGSGIEQALHDHGQDQVALATRLGGEDGIQPELADGPQEGFDVTVGKRLLGGEQVLGGDQRFILQQAAEGLDLLLGPMGEIGEGALVGLVAFAPTFAEEDGGRGVAVGDGLDVHGSNYAYYINQAKGNNVNYMGTYRD